MKRTRICPYPLWQIDAIEGWLDDMATRGYLLEKCKVNNRFVFLKTEPRSARHRIDVLEDEHADAQMRQEEYRDFGWEYVTNFMDYLDIYRATREDAVELNTDEDLLRLALKKARRRNWALSAFVWLLLAVLFVSSTVIGFRYGIYPLLLTLHPVRLAGLAIALPLLAVALYHEIRSRFHMKRRKLLARSYHSRTRENFGRCLNILALAIVPLCCFPDISVVESVDVPDSAYYAYSAQEILPDEGSRDELDGQIYFYHHGLSDQYLWFQKTGSNFSSNYRVVVYETRWNWLARACAREQARLADAEVLTVAGYEGVWFYTGDPPGSTRPSLYQQHIVLLDGNRVVEIHYEGDADLRAAALALK